MQTFTFPIYSIILIWAAMGFVYLAKRLKLKNRFGNIGITIGMIIMTIFILKPWVLLKHRLPANEQRQVKIHNTQIYKKIEELVPPDYIIFNCKQFEDTEVMFYADRNAYSWYPPAEVIDSLKNAGHKIAALKSHTNQYLPSYLAKDTSVLIINEQLE